MQRAIAAALPPGAAAGASQLRWRVDIVFLALLFPHGRTSPPGTLGPKNCGSAPPGTLDAPAKRQGCRVGRFDAGMMAEIGWEVSGGGVLFTMLPERVRHGALVCVVAGRSNCEVG